MSTAGKDPSSALIAGIVTVLSGNVTIDTVTYPVYDTERSDAPNRQYVWVGNYIDNEAGTKDDYVYTGSISIETVDRAGTLNKTRATAQAISNKVRSLLETAKGTTFTVTGYTLSVFRHGGSVQPRTKGRDGRDEIRIIDIYEFVIE